MEAAQASLRRRRGGREAAAWYQKGAQSSGPEGKATGEGRGGGGGWAARAGSALRRTRRPPCPSRPGLLPVPPRPKACGRASPPSPAFRPEDPRPSPPGPSALSPRTPSLLGRRPPLQTLASPRALPRPSAARPSSPLKPAPLPSRPCSPPGPRLCPSALPRPGLSPGSAPCTCLSSLFCSPLPQSHASGVSALRALAARLLSSALPSSLRLRAVPTSVPQRRSLRPSPLLWPRAPPFSSSVLLLVCLLCVSCPGLCPTPPPPPPQFCPTPPPASLPSVLVGIPPSPSGPPLLSQPGPSSALPFQLAPLLLCPALLWLPFSFLGTSILFASFQSLLPPPTTASARPDLMVPTPLSRHAHPYFSASSSLI